MDIDTGKSTKAVLEEGVTPVRPAFHARARETLGRYLARSGRWTAAIAFFSMVIIGIIWAVTLERVTFERANAVSDAVRQNSNLTLALEEYTMRTLRTVDQTLGQLAREYRYHRLKLSIKELVEEGTIDDRLFHNLGVIDEHGRLMLSMLDFKAFDASDREYFRVHQQMHFSGMFIGKPLLGQLSNKWSIHMSRRITKADGSFGGVVFAAVDPHYFTDFYGKADLGRDGLMLLVGLDGIVRARRVVDTPSTGQDMSNSSLLAEQAKAPEGNFLSAGMIEPIPRYVSYRTLPDYPLVVGVGTSAAVALGAFHVRERYYYLGASLSMLFVVLFAGVIIAAQSRQRRMMRAVADSEARLGMTFDQAAAGIALTALDGRIISANAILCRSLGYAEKDFTGSFRQFVHPADVPLLLEDRAKLLSGESSTATRELRYIRKDGSSGWTNRELALVRDPDGAPEYFISVFHDITEGKRAQQELEFKNTLLATQQESSLDAILLVDKDGRILSYNRQFVQLWSIPEEAARAGDDAPVLHAVVGQMQDPEGFLAKVQYLYEHKGEKSHDELQTRNGRTIDRYSAPVIGPNGTYYGRVWYFRDITDRKRQEANLRESEQRFRQMAETIGDVFWMTSPDGEAILYVSPAFEKIWGRSCDELYANRRLWLEAVHPEDAPLVLHALERLAKGERYDIQFRIARPDGAERWINDRGYALRDGTGRVVFTSGIAIDVTERRKTEEQLRLSAKAFESIADGIMVTDARRHLVSVNQAFSAVTGYAPEEVLGKTPRFLQSGRHDAAFYAAMWQEIDRNNHWRGEVWDRRKNGEIYPELLSISAVRDAADAITHYVGVFTDISSLKQYEARLHHQAHHDTLTGLPNRVLFQQRFYEAISRAQRHGHELAVIFLDLDHFKTINDSLGHAVGDLLLEAVAKRLTASVRETDTVARFGGDEFAVLLDAIDDNQAAAGVAQKLLDALAHPYQLAGHELYISASIGISCSPHDGADTETLVKNADTAMYRAKTDGRNNYQFFSAEMNARALETLMMGNSLRLALERDELLLYYQPQYDLKSGRITGVEALIRWVHPELGIVSPARFIPLAEEIGLIEPIGEWVLRTACRQMRAWQDAQLPLQRVAVNLSARQFRHPDLSRLIAGILDETRLPAHHLELELTESMVMQKPEDAAGVLSRLKAMGITIAIDDFGTGYSSLSYLKRMPIDFLKIDQSFVRGIPKDADDAAIIKAIIAMAHSLNLRLIAEGIETSEQRAFLEHEGCEEGQGYLFSQPVPAIEIERLLGFPPRQNEPAAVADAAAT